MANRVYGYQGYKGYQFETSPRKLQPEYEPNKQHKKVAKPKTEKVKQHEQNVHEKVEKHAVVYNKGRAKFVAYLVFGFAILFTISYRNSIINEKFSEKENLKSELAEINKVNEQLQVNVENELNLTSIEKIAKEQLGMNKLNNGQKVYVNLAKKEYVESKAEEIAINNNENIFQKAYSGIKSFFGN